MYRAIGVDPTNDTAAMSGCARIASTATLSPWTTLNTPSGRPASCSSSATNTEAPGSFSEGFRMNVFPQAIALANIHMGTIAGKLNGVMPATTPSGWRIEYTSTPVDTCSENPPFIRLGMPQAYSMFSIPRCDLAGRVGEDLAVLARDDPRELGLALLQQLADAEQDVGPLGQRRRPPGGERLGGRGDRRVHLLGRGEVDLVRLLPRRRVEDGAGAPRLARDDLPADPMADAFHGYHSLHADAQGNEPGIMLAPWRCTISSSCSGGSRSRRGSAT